MLDDRLEQRHGPRSDRRAIPRRARFGSDGLRMWTLEVFVDTDPNRRRALDERRRCQGRALAKRITERIELGPLACPSMGVITKTWTLTGA